MQAHASPGEDIYNEDSVEGNLGVRRKSSGEDNTNLGEESMDAISRSSGGEGGSEAGQISSSGADVTEPVRI